MCDCRPSPEAVTRTCIRTIGVVIVFAFLSMIGCEVACKVQEEHMAEMGYTEKAEVLSGRHGPDIHKYWVPTDNN